MGEVRHEFRYRELRHSYYLSMRAGGLRSAYSQSDKSAGAVPGATERHMPSPSKSASDRLFLRHFLIGTFNVRSRSPVRSLLLCSRAEREASNQKQEEIPWLKQIRASTPAVWPASKRAAWPPLLLWAQRGAAIRSVPDLDVAGVRRKYRTGGAQL
jgi:hypothetical protein